MQLWRLTAQGLVAPALVVGVFLGPEIVGAQDYWSLESQISAGVPMIDEKGYNVASSAVCDGFVLAQFPEGTTRLQLTANLCSPQSGKTYSLLSVTEFGKYILHSVGEIYSSTRNETALGPTYFISMPGGPGINRIGSYTTQSNGSKYRRIEGMTFTTELFDNTGLSVGFVSPAGVRMNRSFIKSTGAGGETSTYGYPSEVEYPDGEKLKYYFELRSYGQSEPYYSGQSSRRIENLVRVRYIVSNKGYGVAIKYASDSTSAANWASPIKVWAYDKHLVYCDESASGICASVSALTPSFSVAYNSSGYVDLSNVAGETKRLYLESDNGSFTSNVASSVDLNVPGSTRTYSYVSGSLTMANRIVDASGTWNYEPHQNSTEYIDPESWVIRTDPNGASRTTSTVPVFALVDYYTDEISRSSNTDWWYATGASAGGVRRRSGLDTPGADVFDYYFSWNKRGNVTSVEKRSADSNAGSLFAYASFPAECFEYKTCNQPLSVTDFLGNTTNFTYDHAHGGVLSEMSPAAASGGARPLKLTTWVQRYAYLKNSSGALASTGQPIWVKSTETQCQTAAGSNPSPVCDTSAQKVVTTYEYGANSTSASLLVKGVKVVADGTTLRTCFGYDAYGRKISETKPRAGLSSCP